MSESMRQRRGPRYRLSGQSSAEASESLRTFREMTDGLSNRLPMPSLESMRAGVVNNPMSLTRRFLVAMRSAGLPKERAQRLAVWTQRQIDCLWQSPDQTPLAVLRERVKRAEAEDDIRELRCVLECSAITVREEIQAKTDQVVANMELLARLERELQKLNEKNP